MNDRSRIILRGAPVICAVLIAVLLTLTVLSAPSGGYIPDSAVNISNRSFSADFSQRIDILVSNVRSEASGMPKVHILPLDDSPAPEPGEEWYSSYVDENGAEHTVYEDSTISVDFWRYTQSFEGKESIINAARVKISHPTQLRTAFAGGKYSLTAREITSSIAQQNNAVIAINADMYNYSTEGVIIRQGTLYNNLATGWDILFIDENGDFIIKSGPEANKSQFFVSDAVIHNSFVFGPALIIDGEVQTHRMGDYNVRNNAFYDNPRTAIGQLGELEYMLVMVEGRSDESNGVKIDALTQIMQELGCIHAYNLDGGQSSAIVMHDKLMNAPSNGGERRVSEIIYFATGISGR